VKSLPSHRLPWSVPPNRFSEEIAALRRAGVSLLDLSNSNPTTAQFRYPHAEIAAAFGAVENFTYDPDPRGLPEARLAVAEYYRQRGYPVDHRRILITASTSEAYSHLFKLLCDGNEEVLIPAPSYPLFEYLAALESVRCLPYHLRYDGSWHIDFDSLLARLSPRTRAIVVVNPNNPTGSLLNRHDTGQLLRIAAERQVAVISDEVFFDYPLRPSGNAVKTLLGAHGPLVFALNGLSKAAGMPQIKLGWMVVDGGDTALVEQTLAQLELVLDTYLSVSTGAQRALPTLLHGIGPHLQTQIQERIGQNFQLLQAALRHHPAHPLFTEAGWSALVSLPRIQSEENWLFALLRDHQVIAQPGYFFDMPSEAYLVLSLITPPEIFGEGVQRLWQLVDETLSIL
jgi:alanine-synthesizing transaminase